MSANKVPAPRSNAGPGCWQCADCNLIVGNDKDECPRCAEESESSSEPDSEQVGLEGF